MPCKRSQARAGYWQRGRARRHRALQAITGARRLLGTLGRGHGDVSTTISCRFPYALALPP